MPVFECGTAWSPLAEGPFFKRALQGAKLSGRPIEGQEEQLHIAVGVDIASLLVPAEYWALEAPRP